MIGNFLELVMLASDGATLVDCLVLNAGTNFGVGSAITVYGYTPGVRYFQNAQGAVTAELVLVGRAY